MLNDGNYIISKFIYLLLRGMRFRETVQPVQAPPWKNRR